MSNYKYLILGLVLASCTSQVTKESVTLTMGDQMVKIPLHTIVEEGLTIPESVTIHKDTAYVANIGGAPMQSLQQGYIAKVTKGEVTKLLEGKLDDPKGFVFLTDNIILVSDHPSVKLVDLSTQEILASVSLEAGFLNDMVKLNDYTALLSDTGSGLIHRISVDTNYSTLTLSVFEGVQENGINGLAFDKNNNTLFFVTSTFGGDATKGHIFEAKLNEDFSTITSIEQWSTPQIGAGGLDGVVLEGDTIIISDWGKDGAENASKIYAYNIPTRELKFTIEGNITSVADISLHQGKLYLPEFLKHKITKIDLKKYL